MKPQASLFFGFRPLGTAGFLVLLLLALNCGFLGLRLAQTFLPKQTLLAEVASGFRNGTLSLDDYPGDYLIGYDQWTDCLAFELALVGAPTRLREALAPEVLSPAGAYKRCPALAAFVFSGFRVPETHTYTRFWHGYSTVMAFALQVMPVRAYRGLLAMLCYGAVAFAACAAGLAGRRLFRLLLPMLLAGFALSGVTQFGPLVSHAPAFIAMWLGGGLLLLLRERLSLRGVLAMALLFGAAEAFVDAMILCPLSAGLAVVFANAAFLERIRIARLRDVLLFNASVLLAWGAGFAGTYVFKLAATMAVLGVDPVIVPFVDQLRLRITGAVDPSWSLFGRLWENAWRIAYGDNAPGASAAVVAAVTVVGWLAAIGRLALARGRSTAEALRVGLGFLVAAVVLLAWCLLFREHTMRHAFFMIRTTILWIAGGWCWFFAQALVPAPYPGRSAVPARGQA